MLQSKTNTAIAPLSMEDKIRTDEKTHKLWIVEAESLEVIDDFLKTKDFKKKFRRIGSSATTDGRWIEKWEISNGERHSSFRNRFYGSTLNTYLIPKPKKGMPVYLLTNAKRGEWVIRNSVGNIIDNELNHNPQAEEEEKKAEEEEEEIEGQLEEIVRNKEEEEEEKKKKKKKKKKKQEEEEEQQQQKEKEVFKNYYYYKKLNPWVGLRKKVEGADIREMFKNLSQKEEEAFGEESEVQERATTTRNMRHVGSHRNRSRTKSKSHDRFLEQDLSDSLNQLELERQNFIHILDILNEFAQQQRKKITYDNVLFAARKHSYPVMRTVLTHRFAITEGLIRGYNTTEKSNKRNQSIQEAAEKTIVREAEVQSFVREAEVQSFVREAEVQTFVREAEVQ